MRRRVTFSRNFTLSLSRTCQCYCKYCAFKTHKAHLHSPEEVERQIEQAVRRNAKELLVLTGERPEVNPEVAATLASWGHADFVSYVEWACSRALERGLLPHTNIGVVSPRDLARLREVTASQGLMLESARDDLPAHQGSPTKDPAVRMAMIGQAGELKIPFTSGILVGIGESESDRFAALDALAAAHGRHGHVQEVILQNFVPHDSYYGIEVAELADESARRFWATGVGERPEAELPDWATGVTVEELERLVDYAARSLPGVGIQVPPNLSDAWPELVRAGATDLGGLSANGDHISPEQPFPSPAQVRREMGEQGVAVAERLCVYPQYIDAEWLAPAPLDTIRARYWSFIPRRGSGRGEAPFAINRDLVGPAIERAAEGRELDDQALTALFAERRPEAVEEIRLAADELRARVAGDEVSFVVNRNINISNVCTVGCAFCGFGQGRRSPDAYTIDREEFLRRVDEAVGFGATELCIQSGIHPDWQLDDYLAWLRLARDAAPQLHLHAYSPMEIAHMCDISGLPPSEVFARLVDAGLGSTPGTAAEVLHDGVRARISPNKLPVGRWVEIIEAGHRAGVPSTSTVMFGHVEEPWELAEHMRVVRGVQERTGGITEFVPLSFVPYNTLLGRRHGIEEISREENLAHTAVFRLALGGTVTNLQASWVKMGLDAATEALHWGVNDLGGTLMEENISRLAGASHGVRLEPAQLVDAAHRAGRPAFERDTLYRRRAGYPLAAGADGAAVADATPASGMVRA